MQLEVFFVCEPLEAEHPVSTKPDNDRVADFFDVYASDFDAIYGTKAGWVNLVISRLFRKSMKERFLRTLKGCQPTAGKRILDIGCGPGHYSVALAKMKPASVLGIDFADGMLAIADRRAKAEGVENICRFEKRDFFNDSIDESFDYVIAMGFMDYVSDAASVVKKTVDLAEERAFFSFPSAGGVLAWQRQVRYRKRCALYLYTPAQISSLFSGMEGVEVSIDKIHRDYFVEVRKRSATRPR